MLLLVLLKNQLFIIYEYTNFITNLRIYKYFYIRKIVNNNFYLYIRKFVIRFVCS